jgi:uncharacterized protein involved in exopolysaccharide biosynthesis
MYEQSKVEEQRQTPSVIVLDRANPAERKSRPKRILIMMGGTLIGLLSAISYVGINIRWSDEQSKNSDLYLAISDLIKAISSDFKNRGK